MRQHALLMLGAGFTIWAAAFVALYAMLSVGCRFGWDEIELAGGITLQRAQLVAIFLIHLAACTLLVFLLCGSGRNSFLETTARWAAFAAVGSLLFVFAPIFFLSAC